MVESDNKAAELAEIVREIRERVRARYPTEGAGGLRLADMQPAVHAREVAAHKVAAIGSVNPRPPGLLNDIAQGMKKIISRGMAWFVRDQVEFNRGVLRSIDTLLEVQNETNRAMTYLAHHADAFEAKTNRIREIETQLSTFHRELDHLRAETSGAIRDWNLRSERQHQQFTEALIQNSQEIQQRFWKEVEAAIAAQQSLIHHELRLIRQRSSLVSVEAPAAQQETQVTPQIDWMQFARKFRGSEESIRKSFEQYVRFYEGTSNILDIGCGRGEFLELMKDAGITARGIDLNPENVALCRSKGLEAERADVFPFLGTVPDTSLGGIFCAQVVEHLTPAQTINLIALCAQKLRSGAPVVFETPNPECLAIFATHFYLDPTHIRPVPPQLLAFYLEEAGFGRIEVIRLSPAEDSLPGLKNIPGDFKQAYFGSLDYAMIARKL